MNLLDPISKIMSTRLITLSPTSSIEEAEKLFQENSIHHIPILHGRELSGIVSKSDVLLFKRGFSESKSEELVDSIRTKTYSVGDIMTTGLAKMNPDDRINVALEVFKENLFHAILVVENEELKGIVTTLDIIRHLSADQEAHTSYN